MQSLTKLAAIFIIWTAFTVIMTTGNSPLAQATGDSAVIMTIVLAIAAGGSTVAISQSGEAHQLREQSLEKAKRTRTRVGRFVDSLGDDEIAELRARLVADDGEVTPLEQLMSEQESRRRH
jgi:hypothetical protein